MRAPAPQQSAVTTNMRIDWRFAPGAISERERGIAIDRHDVVVVARSGISGIGLSSVHMGSSGKTPWEILPSLPLRSTANR